MTITVPGLPNPHARPTAAQYHADLGRWSSTGIRKYAESPWHAYRRYVKGIDDGDNEESTAMRIGSGVNAALLGLKGQVYVAQVSSRRAKAYTDAEQAFPKRTILTIPEHELVCSVADAVLDPQTPAAELAKHFLVTAPGHAEWYYAWTDEPSGVRCRSMVDRVIMLMGRPCVVELKTSMDPSPAEFARQVAQRRYDLQAVINMSALGHALRAEGLDDGRPPGFVWVAVRNDAPFEVAVYMLAEDDYQDAETERVAIMGRLSEHLKDETGKSWRAEWERLDNDTIPTLKMPAWAKKRNARA